MAMSPLEYNEAIHRLECMCAEYLELEERFVSYLQKSDLDAMKRLEKEIKALELDIQAAD